MAASSSSAEDFFEDWLWARCRERRVSLRELAESCGLSSTYWVVRLHRARRGMVEDPPPVRVLACAARYLRLSLATILVRSGALTEDDVRTLPTAASGPIDLEALDEEGQVKLLEYYAMLRRLYGRDRSGESQQPDGSLIPAVPPPQTGRRPRPRAVPGRARGRPSGAAEA